MNLTITVDGITSDLGGTRAQRLIDQVAAAAAAKARQQQTLRDAGLAAAKDNLGR